MPGTRKLGRTSDHRKAMLRAMVTFLFENRQDRDHGDACKGSARDGGEDGDPRQA